MSKGEETKKFIISTAMILFAQRGYAAVTMKDICEACDLSRGGLYRHFGSTKEIFLSMLERDIDKGSSIVQESIANGVPATVILNCFLKGEKEAIFSEHNGLYFAIHEFAFYEQEQKSYFAQRLASAIEIITVILRHGQTNDEFGPFDAEIMARHIIYFLDSLKTSSTIFTMTEKMVDDQFNLLREMIR